jgi:hypothetical protein
MTIQTETPITVTLQKTSTGWKLTRGGKPYFIKGAGSGRQLGLLASLGGNSIRTWGADNLGGLLDHCHSLGLTVTAGIWLGHKEHGFRYLDPASLASQFEAICAHVARYKDHPALLCWALGNEMELGLDAAESEALWKHIEKATQYIHQTDPNHLVLTVVAEVNSDKIAQLKKFAPSIDFLGVNSYGGVESLAERLQQFGWTKPYAITEFGPSGPWEVKKTPWGAGIEPSSTEKAAIYGKRYQKAIATQQKQCLGSYVFLWDEKFEGTTTWFGMFQPQTGEKLGPVDSLTQAWTGKPPKFSCPKLLSFSCDAAEKTLSPEQRITAMVVATGDELRVRYELRRESDGGWLTDLAGTVGKPIKLIAPKAPGSYRLYVTVRDAHGSAATANVPFQVK